MGSAIGSVQRQSMESIARLSSKYEPARSHLRAKGISAVREKICHSNSDVVSSVPMREEG